MKPADAPNNTWVKFSNGKIAYHKCSLGFYTDNHFAARSVYFDGIFESELEVIPSVHLRINENDLLSVISIKDYGGEQRIILKNQYGFTFKISTRHYGMFIFDFVFKTIDKRQPFGFAFFKHDGGKFLNLLKNKRISLRWQDDKIVMQVISICPYKGVHSVILNSK